jgi:uncharacterized RDD family membrane protein YckC
MIPALQVAVSLKIAVAVMFFTAINFFVLLFAGRKAALVTMAITFIFFTVIAYNNYKEIIENPDEAQKTSFNAV